MTFVNNDYQTWSNPPKVGEIRTVIDMVTETRAQAVRWGDEDFTVNLVKVTEFGQITWKVYETAQSDPDALINVFSYSDDYEATKNYLTRAFGM